MGIQLTADKSLHRLRDRIVTLCTGSWEADAPIPQVKTNQEAHVPGQFLARLLPHQRPAVDRTSLQTPGSTGSPVRMLQQSLNRRGRKHGIAIKVTGVYDDATREAVREYQKRALNITSADGLVGPATARSLRLRLVPRER